jgi:hypothetical protein
MLRTAKAAVAGLVRRLGYEIIPVAFAPAMEDARPGFAQNGCR